MAKAITNKVLNATGKLGVHPHHVTKAHVMEGLSSGTISPDECDDLLDFLGDDSPVTH